LQVLLLVALVQAQQRAPQQQQLLQHLRRPRLRQQMQTLHRRQMQMQPVS
jgi:hypothetical protein